MPWVILTVQRNACQAHFFLQILHITGLNLSQALNGGFFNEYTGLTWLDEGEFSSCCVYFSFSANNVIWSPSEPWQWVVTTRMSSLSLSAGGLKLKAKVCWWFRWLCREVEEVDPSEAECYDSKSEWEQVTHFAKSPNGVDPKEKDPRWLSLGWSIASVHLVCR